MKPRFIILGCALIAALVLGYAALSDGGVDKMRELTAQQHELQRRAERARAENEQLVREIETLRGDDPTHDGALERAIREDLGYVRKDEIVVVLDDKEKSEHAP